MWLRQTGPPPVREDRARRRGSPAPPTCRPPTSTGTATSTSWPPRSAGTPWAASSSTRTSPPTGSSRSSRAIPWTRARAGSTCRSRTSTRTGSPTSSPSSRSSTSTWWPSSTAGPGKGFRPETIFRAIVPVWGSSGIEMVDMDKDGDLDLLMSNGDSLDDFTVRPFHGIRWFENEGSYPWKQHDLAIMPGVHRAQAARHGRGRRPRRGRRGLPPERRAPGLPAPRAAGQPRALHLARLAGADEARGLRAPPARAGQAHPHDARPRATSTATATWTSSPGTSWASPSRRPTPASRPTSRSSSGSTRRSRSVSPHRSTPKPSRAVAPHFRRARRRLAESPTSPPLARAAVDARGRRRSGASTPATQATALIPSDSPAASQARSLRSWGVPSASARMRKLASRWIIDRAPRACGNAPGAPCEPPPPSGRRL